MISPARRWSLLAVVSSALLLIALDNTVLYTALPTLIEELGASTSQSLWIMNAYPVVMAGLLLGAGTLGDRLGHVLMFRIGLTVFGVASLVAAYAPSTGVLIGARAFLAVGAASMMPATLALIRVTFEDVRERNLAIAVWGSVAVVGAAIGPIIGGALLEVFWWGSVFLINVPVVVIALIGTFLIAPPDRTDERQTWDLTSSLLAMAGLVSVVIAIKEFASLPPSWPIVGIAVTVAVVSLTLFTRRQLRLAHPLLDFAIFRNNAFSAGVLAAALTMFVLGGLQLVTTQRFQLVEEFTPLQSGLLVTAAALGSAPTALLAGGFLHRVGLRLLIAGGLVVTTIGVVLAATTFTAPIPVFVIALAVTGLGLGAVMGVASTAIVGNAPAHRAGMASSVEEVSYEFGNLTAVAFIGSLVALVYTATLTLPAGAPPEAGDSLATTLLYANGDSDLIETARAAFDHAYLVVMIVIAVVTALGAGASRYLLRHHGAGVPASAHPHH
ncbi:MFS transporter [Aeromicrobium piscarium]|uniref:MFS transporter n=1 Tax=Aeromicrobium piscarium TaxID=2590901 RepID=A0A554RWX2_9ACTN|nr:MFS transporter [Aeromicrobium piscarium]TSD58603.1 MFS transporter [Aeromicrobium piscarium]